MSICQSSGKTCRGKCKMRQDGIYFKCYTTDDSLDYCAPPPKKVIGSVLTDHEGEFFIGIIIEFNLTFERTI